MQEAWALARSSIGSEFLREIVGTFGTRVMLIGTSLVSSVLIARALGPDGRGTLAVAAALTAIVIQFGNLGLHSSNTLAVSRDPTLLPHLIANSIVLTVVTGAIGAAIVMVIGALSPQSLPIGGPLLWLALAGVPIGIGTLLMQNLLLAQRRVRDYNGLELVSRLVSTFATVGLIALGMASPVSLVSAGTLISLAVLAAAVIRLKSLSPEGPRPQLGLQLGLVRIYAGFGLKAYLAALLSFLVIRVDVFLVEGALGFSAVGQYTVATAMADLVYSLPVVVGTLLFPRLARISDPVERREYTRTVLVRVIALMTAASALAALLAHAGITLLYGEDFAPAAPAFILLLPGIVALSAQTVLMNYFAASGLPWRVLLAPAIGLAVNIAANMVLLPPLGIVGASLASSAAYGLTLALLTAYFAGKPRTSSLKRRAN